MGWKFWLHLTLFKVLSTKTFGTYVQNYTLNKEKQNLLNTSRQYFVNNLTTSLLAIELFNVVSE